MRALHVAVLVAFAATASVPPASADAVEDFYKGRMIEIYVGTSETPGSITVYAHTVGDIIGRYIPGHPRTIVRFMPGGAGLKAANYIYGIAPQDGTVYGFIARGFILQPLLVDQAKFEPTKFSWIGSPSRDASIGIVWTAATDVRTIQDAMKNQVVVGGTALSNDTGLFPTMLNDLTGTKFKVVTGYKSVPEVDLAMERGEVQGKVGGTWNSLNSGRTADWVEEGKVHVIVQFGLAKSPHVPSNVPLALDLTRNPEDRQVMSLILAPTAVGHLSFMGPHVPRDRLAAVRAAYAKTMTDSEFVATMKKANFPLDPVYHDEIEKIVDAIYALPPNVVKRARALIPPS
jgi:tripartite-type tricarboxylate transporter receptor subunit TctC